MMEYPAPAYKPALLDRLTRMAGRRMTGPDDFECGV